MNLISKEIDIDDCVPYDGGFTGGKAKWRRTESPMYPKVKASLKRDGMINPLWVFELPGGKYRIAKGCCRAVAAWDLLKEGDERFRKLKVLCAPIGMERRDANRQFRASDYEENIPMLDGHGKEIEEDGKVKYFPKGF